MVKSWPSGAQKWTFPVPTLTDNCSFPFPYILFCSVLVFAAPFTSFLWHDSFVQFFFPHPVWAELWMQQSAPAGQRHRMQWWLHKEEDRGTSIFPAQSSCALFSVFFATQLSVYPKTVPCSSHSCLSVCTQKVTGLSAYLENSSCYRVPYQIACKCIRFVVQKMNEFILIHVNYIFSQ